MFDCSNYSLARFDQHGPGSEGAGVELVPMNGGRAGDVWVWTRWKSLRQTINDDT